MKKTIYTAPDVEQISVRFEENIMSGEITSSTPQKVNGFGTSFNDGEDW